ncbi:MAG: sugar phosphate isomerase/epimerase family protein [Tepidisphaeraceae bacterium]
MLRLSGFADEIGPEIDDQIATCKKVGVTHFELRGVRGKNVLDFNDALKTEIKSKLREADLGVVCIGSPIGKVAIDKPWSDHFDRFKIAVEMAEFFEAPLIRVFSYYPVGGEGKGDIAPHRDEILHRFREKIAYVDKRPVTLVHENEKGIFGDIGSRCVDLMTSINHPKLRTAFDFANFIQCGQDPLAIWPQLKPFTKHIHVKDALKDTGKVVPAGQGDGQLAPIIKDAFASGYRGFLSLEPHLKVAGHSHGETGPELFAKAVQALRDVCKSINVPLAS